MLSDKSIELLSGYEPIRAGGNDTQKRLIDFWRWSASDLRAGPMLSALGQYLVGLDVTATAAVRTRSNSHEVSMPSGDTLLVCTTRACENPGDAPSGGIVFDLPVECPSATDSAVSPTKVAASVPTDFHVFALWRGDVGARDPLDTDDWEFLVLPSISIAARHPTCERLTLTALDVLDPLHCRFGEIAIAVRALASECRLAA